MNAQTPMTRRVVLNCVGILVFSTAAVFGQASFMGLGKPVQCNTTARPTGISSDGAIAAGTCSSVMGTAEALRFENGNWQSLGDLAGGQVGSAARAISGDGLVIIGESSSNQLDRDSFVWSNDMMQRLGSPAGVVTDIIADSVSGDGSVVAGSIGRTSTHDAFSWKNGQFTLLGALTGDSSSDVEGISGDGSVAVGLSWNIGGPETAVFWKGNSPTPFRLAVLPECVVEPRPRGVSYDGAIVVASCRDGHGPDPLPQQMSFRVESGHVMRLETLSGAIRGAIARSVSGDGAIVVGDALHDNSFEPAVWFGVGCEPTSLHGFLESKCGLDLGSWLLTSTGGISADGTTIHGFGQNPQGISESWLARLPHLPPIIASSDPIHESIDARSDWDVVSNTPHGTNTVRIRFTTEPQDLITETLGPGSFSVMNQAGIPFQVIDVVAVINEPHTYDVLLADDVQGGTWTTITPIVQRADGMTTPDLLCTPHVTFGILSGDVNGNRLTDTFDILALIDTLNEVAGAVRPLTSTDIDRSGESDPMDILRLLELFDGVQTTVPWGGISLPPLP